MKSLTNYILLTLIFLFALSQIFIVNYFINNLFLTFPNEMKMAYATELLVNYRFVILCVFSISFVLILIKEFLVKNIETKIFINSIYVFFVSLGIIFEFILILMSFTIVGIKAE